MRVLHLSWEYPPVVHGGLGRYVDAVTRAQAAGGGDVVVAAPADDLTDASALPAAADEVRDGVRVLRVPLPRDRPHDGLVGLMRSWQDSLVASVRDRLHDNGFDVVHAHDWMVAEAGGTLARTAGVRFVLTLHATEHGRRFGRFDEPVHRAVHTAERAAVNAADAVVVSSPAMAGEAVAHGAHRARVHVVPPGVEATRWHVGDVARGAARQHWARDGQHLVVAAGRLEWEKGFSTLLRALPAVADRHPSVRLVLAGTGSYEPVLRALAADLRLTDRVTWAGRLAADALAALLGAADVVVAPSRYEPFGLVALEAQAAGTAVVVTRTGGLAGLVEDGVTGRLVEPGDVDRLAVVLADLVADPVARQRLARAGQTAARTRSWHDAAARLVEIYRTVSNS